jgi:hypothetical protein
MRGRAFLELAREVVKGNTERHWRGATVHAYYALLLECRDALVRWGRPAPRQQSIHTVVRLTFDRATNKDLRGIGDALNSLSQGRSKASYDLSALPMFSRPKEAHGYIQRSADALALLDAIEADPARRGAAIASLPPP